MTGSSENGPGTTKALGHEPSTLNGGRVAIWGLALACLIAFTLAATWGMRRWLQVSQGKGASASTPPVVNTEGTLAAQTVLNPDQRASRLKYQRQQNVLLTEYAWVDRQRELVRIPIERAMQIVVDRTSEQQ